MDQEDYARATDLAPIRGETLPAGRAITGGELSALFAACANDPTPAGYRDAALLAVLYSGGLRRAEAHALMMEHYDTGFSLSYQIRKNDRFKNVPLVMLSGVASQTGRRFDQQADELKKWSKLDAFMDKPVTGKQLLKMVEEKLGLAPEGGRKG